MTDESHHSGVRLVTRGDDAALAEGVNDAIRTCFDDGLLRNVSVMAPGPALEHAAERLASVDGLCVGVHVTLTAEWDHPNWGPVLPSSKVPSLTDPDGDLPLLAEQFVERDPDPSEVIAEIEAQIDAVRAAGFEPSYLDTHMALEREVDWFAEAFLDVCEREGLRDGTAVPPLLGTNGVGTGPEWLVDHLSDADPGTYLVVGHPAYENEETAAVVGPRYGLGEVAADRANQRRMFIDDRVVSYCADHGVETVRYDDL